MNHKKRQRREKEVSSTSTSSTSIPFSLGQSREIRIYRERDVFIHLVKLNAS